jgi:hypothetical protein
MVKEKKNRKTREEEAKKKAKLQEKKVFESKLQDLGLEYKEVDIPPDEVDRNEVAKDLLFSLKSMIPGTQEYYESLRAEEEMDDLLKIQIERTRAQELISKSRLGREDEALQEMMDEVKDDFHYFNKIKDRMTQEGKFKYVPPNFDPFKFISRGQNRLRKAVVSQFALLDESLMKKLGAHGREMASLGVRLQEEKDEPCVWRYVIFPLTCHH